MDKLNEIFFMSFLRVFSKISSYKAGHVVFSNITNLSKLEHDTYPITLETVNHGYKGTNDISSDQELSYYRSCNVLNETTCPV